MDRKRISGTTGARKEFLLTGCCCFYVCLVFFFSLVLLFACCYGFNIWEDGLCQDPISRLAQSSGLF